ncbi:hypothetical protein ACLESD_14945 [Pyxidicoccus sp. 3LFB2]
MVAIFVVAAPVRAGADPGHVLSAGYSHSLALRPDGTVSASGANWDGQLGDGTTTRRNSPVQVDNLTSVTSVAAGHFHSLALRSDGTVWAWGNNSNGALGDKSTTKRLKPVQVADLAGVIAVAAGARHSLALRSDGTVWAWGNNQFGQLGNWTNTSHNSPVKVVNLTNVTAVAAGFDHSLALRSDGTVWAWGWNRDGQLGNGTTNSNSPVQVPNLTSVTAISAGYYHSLALRFDGTVWAWGWNYDGQLGTGTNTQPTSPVRVVNLTNVTTIVSRGIHSLARCSDGSVWAWGANADGQLGNGTTTKSNSPVQVHNLTNVKAVSSGVMHSLAVQFDGSVSGWGYNFTGELGNGTTTSLKLPAPSLFKTKTLSGGGWTVVGAPSFDRSFHPAVLLNSGHVLSLGGWAAPEADLVVDLFNPATGQWSQTGSLRSPRINAALVKLTNGNVLVAGGWGGGDGLPEVFSGGAWRTIPNFFDYRPDFPTLTLLDDDTALLVGGSWSSSMAKMSRYNPNTDLWSDTAPSLTYARLGHTATRMSDGRVLIIGGTATLSPIDSPVALNYTEIYQNGNVVHGLDLLSARAYHTATLLSDGRGVLVIGGVSVESTETSYSYVPVPSAELYMDGDIGFGWTAAPPSGRFFGHTATLLKDGRVLKVGGSTTYLGAGSTVVELYDPKTRTWETGPSMTYPRSGHTATLLLDGRVLIDGGGSYSSFALPSEIFTP